MEELKSFVFLAALTTFFLILTLTLSTKKQLLTTTVIYGFLFFLNFIVHIRRNFNFQDYEMLKFLDKTMLLIYLFPFILGIILLINNKSINNMALPKK
ncbi:hypothetical protein MKY37_20700 [Psychrobacillus sp. FSL K6-2836]|uniref:hypothetical protein n=1 Tax=Psychrobacillus sp. FSL K6-2836 TaxID=2921548 RepID=UPI0030F87821